MSYIEPELVKEAKKIDLLTYLELYDPSELVHLNGNTYTTKTHDSLKISNGKWMWWSRGIGGHNALDYLIKVKGLSFIKAVETIIGEAGVSPASPKIQEPKVAPKVFHLPVKAETNEKVIKYLNKRGIDVTIINDCIKKGLIFESMPYHNAVFLGQDEYGKTRYAAYRATNKSLFKGDAAGSDKRFSFRLSGCNDTHVHVFESAIDALSYATLMKMDSLDWRKYTLLSLAGIYAPRKNSQSLEAIKIPAALNQYLKIHPETKIIYLHLDNDSPGRNATEVIKSKLANQYTVIDCPPPHGKDVNDYLCLKINNLSKKKENHLSQNQGIPILKE